MSFIKISTFVQGYRLMLFSGVHESFKSHIEGVCFAYSVLIFKYFASGEWRRYAQVFDELSTQHHSQLKLFHVSPITLYQQVDNLFNILDIILRDRFRGASDDAKQKFIIDQIREIQLNIKKLSQKLNQDFENLSRLWTPGEKERFFSDQRDPAEIKRSFTEVFANYKLPYCLSAHHEVILILKSKITELGGDDSIVTPLPSLFSFFYFLDVHSIFYPNKSIFFSYLHTIMNVQPKMDTASRRFVRPLAMKVFLEAVLQKELDPIIQVLQIICEEENIFFQKSAHREDAPNFAEMFLEKIISKIYDIASKSFQPQLPRILSFIIIEFYGTSAGHVINLIVYADVGNEIDLFLFDSNFGLFKFEKSPIVSDFINDFRIMDDPEEQAFVIRTITRSIATSLLNYFTEMSYIRNLGGKNIDLNLYGFIF